MSNTVRGVIGVCLFALSTLAAGENAMLAGQANLQVTLATKPSPALLGQNQFEVMVKDAKGQPVTDVDASLLLVMPAMPAIKHPEMRSEVKLKHAGSGRYTGAGMITMAGQWNATVSVKREGKEIGQQTSRLTVQMKAQSASPETPHKAHTHTHPEAAKLKNPVPADAKSIAAGEQLFSKECASCHGSTGKGDGKMAAKLKTPPPDLTDAEWTHGSSDGEIFVLIRDGSKGTPMKGYRSRLTTTQIWQVVNYLRSISAQSR
jgi:mono/diheme cytochrome c family protein